MRGTLEVFLVLLVEGLIEMWGSTDFIQYWTALQLAASGENPYHAADLLLQQQALVPERMQVLMMWNPPWILLLLYPVLTLPWEQSYTVWLVINCLIGLWVCAFGGSLWQGAKGVWGGVLAIALFYPFWNCLSLGQISLFLLFGGLLLVQGVLGNSMLKAGVGAVIVSLKPHLFLFLGIVLLIRILRQRLWRPFVGIVGMFGVTVASTEAIYPGLISLWIGAHQDPPEGAVPPFSYAVPTLVGVVRQLGKDDLGHIPVWPLFVMPLVGMALYVAWQSRRSILLDLQRVLPGLLGVSFLFSSYGWVFDMCLLMPAWIHSVQMTAREPSRASAGLLGLGLTAQAVPVYLTEWSGRSVAHSELWWFPVVILLVWMLLFIRSETKRHLAVGQTGGLCAGA